MTPTELQDLLFEELGYREAASLETYNPGGHLVFPLPHVEQVYRVKGVPVAYFTHLEAADPTLLRQLHKNIWNESRGPLLYVVMPQQIRVYNTYATPAAPDEALDDETRLLEHLDGLIEIETTRQQIRRLSEPQRNYSRLYLETGAFWATTDGQKIRRESRADQRLLAWIEGACRYLIERGIEPEMAFSLVGRSIFIRYLEDRGLLTPGQIADAI